MVLLVGVGGSRLLLLLVGVGGGRLLLLLLMMLGGNIDWEDSLSMGSCGCGPDSHGRRLLISMPGT